MVKPPAPPVTARSMATLTAALGLPADRLSASIVSFARFFSLPLKPQLMAEIRRQVLASAAAQPEPTAEAESIALEKRDSPQGTAAKNREALSLAAAACKDKGVGLSPQGLRAYAAAVEPDWEGRHGGGRERHRRQRGGRDRENETEKTGAITSSELRKVVLETEAADPLLATLNRLPGKNGRRWIVLPFSFGKDGREFFVSLRIMLAEENRASHMAIDCAEVTESGKAGQRWHFALEFSGNRITRLAVFVHNALSPKARAQLAQELSRHMGIPGERVSVQSCTGSFPCESCVDELLRSINEAV